MNMNMNMNVNNNGRKRRAVPNKTAMHNHLLKRNRKMEYFLQNLDLLNFCETKYNAIDKEHLNLCSEEVIERAILTTFSLMQNILMNKTSNCKFTINTNNIIDKVVSMSFVETKVN